MARTQSRSIVARVAAGGIATLVVGLAALACNSHSSGTTCSAPMASGACSICSSTSCGAPLQTLCPDATGCYCTCMINPGGDLASCAQSCIASSCAQAGTCTVATCLANNCSDECGVSQAITMACYANGASSSGGGSQGASGSGAGSSPDSGSAAASSGGSSSGSTSTDTSSSECPPSAGHGGITGDGLSVNISNASVALTIAQVSPLWYMLHVTASSAKGQLTDLPGSGTLDVQLQLDGAGLAVTGAGSFSSTDSAPQDAHGTGTLHVSLGTKGTETLQTGSSAGAAGSFTVNLDGSAAPCGGQVVGASVPLQGGSLTANLVDPGSESIATLTLNF